MSDEDVFDRFEIGIPVKAVANGATGVVSTLERSFTGALRVLVKWDQSGFVSLCLPGELEPLRNTGN